MVDVEAHSDQDAGTPEISVTPEMRLAGALALEDLEGAGSCEEKAAAAYRAMVLANNPR